MYKNNVDGYKCFNKDLVCNYGNLKMKPNTIYEYDKDIKFHNSGFHFCKRLEDTLKFFGDFDNEKVICKIKALGDIKWNDDEIDEYFDMGTTNIIYIGDIMTRKEIIDYIDKVYDMRFIRFITWFKLNDEELAYFKNKYKDNNYVYSYLLYYQEGDKEVFNRECGVTLKR